MAARQHRVMRRIGITGLLWLLLGWPCGALAREVGALGYVGWWMPQGWRSVTLEKFERVLFFHIEVSGSGSLEERHGWPQKWAELREAVQTTQVPLDLTLTLLDEKSLRGLLADEPAQQRFLAEATELAADPVVAGLQLDVELYDVLDAKVLVQFNALVMRLAQQLQQATPPKKLSVFMPMGGKSRLYSAQTAQSLDYVVLQGYDAHWADGGRAGPVAPLRGPELVTWEKSVAQGLALGIPRERMFLSFPLYGYEWPVKSRRMRGPVRGGGQSTTFAYVDPEVLPDIRVNVQAQVRRYGASHDPVSASSYYQYQEKPGQWVEGWFEDWWSLATKRDYLRDNALGGMAFFVLGYDQGELVESFHRPPKLPAVQAPAQGN